MAKNRDSDSDDDLDEELFQLTEKKSNKRSKSIDSSDEDYEDNKNKKKKTTSGPGRKKGSTSMQQSTINYGSSNRRNRGATIENDDDFYDGYDEELYKDDNDRYELSLLPEIDRENILSERYEKRKEARELWLQQKSIRDKEKKSGGSSSSSQIDNKLKSQSSTRGRSEKEDRQREALKDIQKKRERSKRDKEEEEETGGSASSSTNNTPTTLSANSTPKTSSSRIEQDNRDKSREKEKERERERENERKIERDIQRSVDTLNINLMNQCRLSRNMLVKWVDQPYFEKYAPKFFVRVVIGSHLNNPIYRIAEIINIGTGHKIYKVEDKETDKLLVLSYAGSIKEFGIENVSNNAITPAEHEKWISDMIRAKKTLPTPEDIETKIGDIKKAQDYIYTNEDIDNRAKERIKYQKTPVNIAIEKAKLIALRETLVPQSPKHKAICEKIDSLTKLALDIKEENVSKVDQLIQTINKKNKSLNFKYQSTTQTTTEQVSNEFDPFARRKTRNCAVVAADTSSLIISPTTTPSSTSSPINAALSPSAQFLEKSKNSSNQSNNPSNIDSNNTRSLYEVHRSIDLNIHIPDHPNKILSIQPKKKRQIIPANIVKNDHSMFKTILSLNEYLIKRDSMVQ
ncbi:hypothetical protein RB653_000267 [Dictyostelium firmibasis]|uniref:Plus3 domain-containing protein n=1 Tax=Dictyostelium firmibasis TaxID=79012 RepID=A0AAN7YXR8_9MYCE